MFRLFNPCSPCCQGGVCNYRIKSYLDWSGNGDLNLYGKVLNDLIPTTVYYDLMSYGGLSLNVDAHPSCNPTPVPPEIISGVFTGSNHFMFWYNQHSNTLSEATTVTRYVQIDNIGIDTIWLFQPNDLTIRSISPGSTYTYSNIPRYTGYNMGDESDLDINRYLGNSVIASCYPQCSYMFMFVRTDSNHLLYCQDLDTSEICWRDNPVTTNCFLSLEEDRIISKTFHDFSRFKFWFSSTTGTVSSTASYPKVMVFNIGGAHIWINDGDLFPHQSFNIIFDGSVSCVPFVSGTTTKEDYGNGYYYEFRCFDNCCVGTDVDHLYLYAQTVIHSDYADPPDIIELTKINDNDWVDVDEDYIFHCTPNTTTSYLGTPIGVAGGPWYDNDFYRYKAPDNITYCPRLDDDCNFCNPSMPWWTIAAPIGLGVRGGFIISESDTSVVECVCKTPISKDLYLTINSSCSNGHDLSGTVVHLNVGALITTPTASVMPFLGGMMWSGDTTVTKTVTVSGHTGSTTYHIKVELISRDTDWFLFIYIDWTGVGFGFGACSGDSEYSSANITYNCDPFELEADIYMGSGTYSSCGGGEPVCSGQVVNVTITE